MSTKCAVRGQKLLSAYRYALQTIRRSNQKAQQATNQTEVREAFEKLLKSTDEKEIQKELKDVWGKLSVIKMDIMPSLRPQPSKELTDYLIEQGVITPSSVSRHAHFVVHKGEMHEVDRDDTKPRADRSRRYNMALQDSDVRRHIALNERFHFNGPERGR